MPTRVNAGFQRVGALPPPHAHDFGSGEGCAAADVAEFVAQRLFAARDHFEQLLDDAGEVSHRGTDNTSSTLTSTRSTPARFRFARTCGKYFSSASSISAAVCFPSSKMVLLHAPRWSP